jgi:tetratricopeptide (TPR) repeat protein
VQLLLGVLDGVAEPKPFQPPPPLWDDDSAVRRRLARVYLRTGSLPAARVELESLAGRNLLDGVATLDLAEVRWRTGDPDRAGEAARAYLDGGGDDALAFVIAAEAAARAGHQLEARRYLEEAVRRQANLETAYAGMPSRIAPAPGPIIPAGPATSGAVTPPGLTPAPAAAQMPAASGTAGSAKLPVAAEAVAQVSVAPAPAAEPERTAPVAPAHSEVSAGAAVLASGDPLMAAVHFGVALRTGAASAPAVLDAIGNRHEAALELVRGDALRLLGRDDEAARAHQEAAGALRAIAGADPGATAPAPALDPGSPPAADSE